MKRIPTILGIFLTVLLVAGLAVASSQVQKVTRLFSSADESVAPTSVGVGNITDSGFTVYWLTGKETSGAVFWGKTTKLGDGVAVDDRDLSSPNGKFSGHFVRVTNLSPSQKYYFKIGSGANTFGDTGRNDEPFETSTLNKTVETSSQVEPIFGKVSESLGAPAAGVIIFLESAPGKKVVALSKTDGTYVLPLLYGQRDEEEVITLESGTGEKATITCKPGLDRPLPEVKLGQDLDCSKTLKETVKAAPTIEASTSSTPSINIAEGETVPSTLPTISGQAGPNQIVKIEIHSETTYSATVKADPAGNWSWTPPANLDPGQHTVTITIVSADGTTQTVTRTFYVSSDLPILPVTSGTPSAQLPPTPPATPTPTPQPSPPPTPPVTGRTEETIFLLIAGLVSATLGTWIIRHQS